MIRAGLAFAASLPARALLALIAGYRRFVSPAIVALGGAGGGCRFHPSCSQYSAEAIATHGAAVGSWLTVCRLAKCSPLHPGGLDPVPARQSPRCVRVTT